MSNSNLTGTDGPGRWYGNLTLIMHPELCTVKTCDLTLASFLYIPSLPGNAIYAAIFTIYIVAQLFLGIKHKTWGYMAAMVLGLALEVFGYVARIMLHNDPFNNNDFLMYLVALTIAPALLSASVSCPFSVQPSLLTSPPPDLPVPLSHCRRLWRDFISLSASYIHHRLLHLRLHLSRLTSIGRRHCIDGQHEKG